MRGGLSLSSRCAAILVVCSIRQRKEKLDVTIFLFVPSSKCSLFIGKVEDFPRFSIPSPGVISDGDGDGGAGCAAQNDGGVYVQSSRGLRRGWFVPPHRAQPCLPSRPSQASQLRHTTG